MACDIHLPTYLTARGVGDAVSTARIGSSIRSAEERVVIHADDLQYADPFGMAVLGASFHSVIQNGYPISIRGLNKEIRNYLERMDVFHGVELEPDAGRGRVRHDRTDSLVELTAIHDHALVDVVARRLAKAIIGRDKEIDFDEPRDEMTCRNQADLLVEPLQYGLTELLENALTHARRAGRRDAGVWIASQYYRRRGRLSIGVVDDGCGFLETLRGHRALKEQTDHDAILAALTPRVSCNRDLGVFGDTVNQGVGLTTTARIFQAAGGKLTIVSGYGFHDTSGGRTGSAPSGVWGGVAMALECQRDRLSGVRYQELLPSLEDLPQPLLRFE